MLPCPLACLGVRCAQKVARHAFRSRQRSKNLPGKVAETAFRARRASKTSQTNVAEFVCLPGSDWSCARPPARKKVARYAFRSRHLSKNLPDKVAEFAFRVRHPSKTPHKNVAEPFCLPGRALRAKSCQTRDSLEASLQQPARKSCRNRVSRETCFKNVSNKCCRVRLPAWI